MIGIVTGCHFPGRKCPLPALVSQRTDSRQLVARSVLQQCREKVFQFCAFCELNSLTFGRKSFVSETPLKVIAFGEKSMTSASLFSGEGQSLPELTSLILILVELQRLRQSSLNTSPSQLKLSPFRQLADQSIDLVDPETCLPTGTRRGSACLVSVHVCQIYCLIKFAAFTARAKRAPDPAGVPVQVIVGCVNRGHRDCNRGHISHQQVQIFRKVLAFFFFL